MNNTMTTAELIMPERQLPEQPSHSRLWGLGYLCRCILAFLCTYGLAMFLCDALSLGIPRTVQLAVCFGICTLFSVMGISLKCYIVGGIAGIATIIFWFINAGGLSKALMTLFYAGVSIYNAWFRRLNELGYNGMLSKVLNFDYTLRQLYLTEENCRMIAFVVIMLVIGAIISLCTLRRARLLPILFVGAALATLMMYFGLCTDNGGFAMMIASLCGVSALSYYDHLYTSRKHISRALGTAAASPDSRAELSYTLRANSALGGFTGLGAALIALALLWFPSKLDSGMRDIPIISEPALRLENFIVAMVNGENPDLSGLVFSGISAVDSRSTATERRTYDGSQIFEVQTEVDIPVYLRNWVGLDYYEDSWHTASYERINDYREIFGTGFSPELLTFELLYAIDPELVTLPDGVDAVPHTEFGYITSMVHTKKLFPTANIIFMPSHSDPRHQLLRYNTREREDISYANYYDGIFTSTSYLFLDEYSTITNIPVLRDPNVAQNISLLVDYFAEQYSNIILLRTMLEDGASDAMIQRQYELLSNASYAGEVSTVDGSYTFPTGEKQLSWRYVYEMDDTERARIHALIDNLSLYYNYVYDNYLTGCEEFARFRTLATEIVEAEGLSSRAGRGFAQRHKAIMAIIDYLSANMVYTLSPKNPTSSREYINAAESFLFDTAEGYCVQYATSAVMLLRSLGIPARYAEGYITGKYTRLSSENAAGTYSSTIVDSNAHAWIEVYYDYYGWVQYEATAPYYSSMYNPDNSVDTELSTDTSPIDTSYYEEMTDTEEYIPTAPIIDDDNLELSGTAVTVIILAAVGCAVAVVFILLKRRGDMAETHRRELIAAACSRTLDDEARLSAASALDDMILKLLAYKKLSPASGEQFSRFAERVDETLGSFSSVSFTKVSRAMLAAEFGTGVSNAELELIARYLGELTDYILRDADFLHKRYLKYFYLAS